MDKNNNINRKKIVELLAFLNISANTQSFSLTNMCKIAGLTPDLKRKEAIIAALADFYSEADAFQSIYNKLNNFERELIDMIVHCNGYHEQEEIEKIIRKYPLKRPIKDSSGRIIHFYHNSNFLTYFSEKSAAHLLFLKGSIPEIFIEELKKIISPMNFLYSVLGELPKDCVLIEREKRYLDFEQLVKFCNQNKVTLTAGGLLSKSSAIKLIEDAGYDELCEYGTSNPKDARNITQLKVTFPLVVLAFAGSLLTAADNRAVPGENASSVLRMSPHAMIEKIYKSYLKTTYFAEIDYLKGIKVSRRAVSWSRARRAVCELLAQCPAGQFLHYHEFERYLRLTNRLFIRSYVGYVEETGTGDFCAWDSFEHPLIRLIMSFLSTLGIIDIAWITEEDDFGNLFQEISAFKITPLGAWILKIEKQAPAYEVHYSSNSEGFVVQPNFEILVPGGRCRILHELYFERFLTRVSNDAAVSTYRLDFESMVRALDNGITISEITNYLTNGSDKPVPENVLQGLSDWERQAKRIRLRRVTILETDDLFLLEEIRRIKGMGEYISGEIGPSVSILETDSKKIKRLLEKNKRFCKEEL